MRMTITGRENNIFNMSYKYYSSAKSNISHIKGQTGANLLFNL